VSRGTTHPKKQNGANRGATFATHNLTADGVVRGPDLSEVTDRTWDADVLRWYQTWRESPQAQLFEATDWQRLALLATLVEKLYSGPTAAVMSEIRMNEERLGATFTDRMRARISITNETTTEEAARILSIVPGQTDDDLLD
jgi:hypothetical protein